MRIFIFFGILTLFSCTEKQETIAPPGPPNPWEYINRISDTLPETEFSLFNTPEENLEKLKKFNVDKLYFKYRVGQNKYITVKAVFIKTYYAACIMLDRSYINFGLTQNEELLIDWDYFENIYECSSDTICRYIFKNLDENYSNKKHISFTLQFYKNLKQETIIKAYDKIAEGYLIFLDKISLRKYRKKVSELDINKLNKLISEYPLFLEYNFYDLLNRLKFIYTK